jgi:hypothetical protein
MDENVNKRAVCDGNASQSRHSRVSATGHFLSCLRPLEADPPPHHGGLAERDEKSDKVFRSPHSAAAKQAGSAVGSGIASMIGSNSRGGCST